jgi:hypothetical protein
MILIAAMLACSDPFKRELEYSVTTVKSVAVSPPSGNGEFTMAVNYETYWSLGKIIPGILCYYVTPTGVTQQIGTINLDLYNGADKIINEIQTLTFTVTQPGIYLAGCAPEKRGGPVTTTFTVLENATPTPKLPVQITATPTRTTKPTLKPSPRPKATRTATPQAKNLQGKIVFDYHSYQSSRPSGAGELDRITKWCIPEVIIAPDGIISGTCEFSGTADLVKSTVIASVTGSAVQGGSFNFTYTVTEKGSNGWDLKPGENPSVPVWSNEAKWEISYIGSGNFTSATQASGTANFDFTCDSGADNLLWCWKQPKESFSGTIKWSFIQSQ